jgi:hypothetical protein
MSVYKTVLLLLRNIYIAQEYLSTLNTLYFTLLLFTCLFIADTVVQSWPEVLRMTQILIYTKFAASVSLDIFVRSYYGILKYKCQRLLLTIA